MLLATELGRQRSDGRPIAMAALALRALLSGQAALGQLQPFWIAPNQVIGEQSSRSRKQSFAGAGR
jgi:hypothetical protein